MSSIFVGGSQRSGTTLLQTLLCQDETVNPLIGEAKYLRHLLVAYRFGKMNFSTETKDYFHDPAAYRLFNRNLLSLFLEQTRALYPRASHLVLREPHLTMYFPDLHELVPDALFICIVRDPRDAVASMIDVGEKLTAGGQAQDAMARLFASRRIDAICAHYLSFYAPAFAARSETFRRRCAFVRYEDLVQRPAEYLGRLRALTGLALANCDPARAPDTGRVDYSAAGDYQRAWNTPLSGSKVEDSQIGRYRNVLQPGEVSDIERNCAPLIQRFSYAPATA